MTIALLAFLKLPKESGDWSVSKNGDIIFKHI